MRYVTEAEVANIMNTADYIKAVEEGYRLQGLGQCFSRPRDNIWFSSGEKTIKSLFGVIPQLKIGGALLYTGGYGRHRVPARKEKVMVLFDLEEGEAVAVIEAEHLSWMRTGASSAVATKYLADRKASKLGVIGTGKQAESQILCICNVQPIDTILLYNRTGNKAEQFKEKIISILGPKYDVVTTGSVNELVAAVDIISTVTTSGGPLFGLKSIKKGTHINAIGAHYPHLRELDSDTIINSKVVVDYFAQALEEKGEIIIPIQKELYRADGIYAEIGEIVCGNKQGRISDEEITVFCSGGTAVEYLAVAAYIYSKLTARDK